MSRSRRERLGSSIDQSIFTGNFFGSGKPDFAVPDTGSTPGIFILQNTSSAGAFSLAAAVKTPYAALQGAMVGSFTGSGFSDLVAANGATLTVLVNDGTGNFTASYATLTIAFTSSQFTVADANGDGYTDIYTVSSQNGQPQISVNLVTGSASAISQPFSLSAGTQTVSAAWAGNVNFAGSTATGTQTVNGTATTTTVASSQNPSVFGASITLTATSRSARRGTCSANRERCLSGRNHDPRKRHFEYDGDRDVCNELAYGGDPLDSGHLWGRLILRWFRLNGIIASGEQPRSRQADPDLGNSRSDRLSDAAERDAIKCRGD